MAAANNGKQGARNRALATLKHLGPEYRRQASEIAATLLAAAVGRRGIRLVLSFCSIDGEPDTRPLHRSLHEAGVAVATPRVSGMEMVFHRLSGDMILSDDPAEDPADGWIPSRWGILEPAPSLPVVDGREAGLIVVPGLAFAVGGRRLGRGAGFYDRYLALHPSILRAGLTFSALLFADIPVEPHDQPMDLVVTEEGVGVCTSRGRGFVE